MNFQLITRFERGPKYEIHVVVTHQTISWEQANKPDLTFLEWCIESWFSTSKECSHSFFKNWAGNVV